MQAKFPVIEDREESNNTLRRLILAGSLLAESARQGKQNLVIAKAWEEYLERWQIENQLKKVK